MYKLADGTMSTDYKVGDKFVISEEHFYFGIGKIVTLLHDDGSDNPTFDEGICVKWYRLKAYKSKEFTKSDLKDGMVVTYRDGGKRLVFNDRTYYSEAELQKTLKSGFILELHFNDRLEHTCRVDMDIMKVEYMGEVLWERIEETPEQKEIKRLQGIIKEAQAALNLIGKGD